MRIYQTFLLYKLFSLCALIVLMLISSCDNDAYVRENESVELTFSMPVVRGITRTVTDTELGVNNALYPSDENFRVFCAMYNKEDKTIDWTAFKDSDGKNGDIAQYDVSLNGWVTNTRHYWAANVFYAFRAFSPAVLKGDIGDHGIEINDYVTPASGKQFDMMYSETSCNVIKPEKKETNTTGYNGVNMLFRHALSSVHFRVCISSDYMNKKEVEQREEERAKFKVRQITLAGVANTGSFKENSEVGRDTDGKLTYKHGTPSWSLDKDSLTAGSYNFLTKEIVNLPYDVSKTSGDVAVEVKDYEEGENHIGFMIPQELSADARIIIEWSYGDYDQTSTIYLNNKDKNKVNTVKWKTGMRYTYVIAFTQSFIYFEPSATDMIEVDGGNVNIE